MKEYTKKDVGILLNKLSKCLYSRNQLMVFANQVRSLSPTGLKPIEVNKFRKNYYADNFFLELSELYKFFRDREDATIQSQFSTSEDQRSKLKKVRNLIAHLDSNVDEAMKTYKDYVSITYVENEDKDLVLMIKRLRTIAVTYGFEAKVLGDLKVVQDLFPREILEEGMRKDIFE